MVQAENYSNANNVTPETCTDTGGGQDVGRIQNGSWCAYNNVDFGAATTGFSARIASAGSGGSIQIRLGSTTGTLVGTLTVPVTGGWQTWQTVSTNISVSGVTNLYLVFAGGSGYLFNVNWFQYVGGAVAAPAQPTGLTATPSNALVVLNWISSGGATSYKIKRSTISGSGYSTIATNVGINNTAYTNIGLVNGTTYYFVVSALNSGGESTNSVEVNATPMAPPATPSGVTATAGNGRVKVTWNASPNADTYTVRRWVTGSATNIVHAKMLFTSCTDFTVGVGTNYNYSVSAVNIGGQSSQSVAVNATPLAGASSFLHPGILRTQTDLNRIKTNILSGQEPWKTALQKVYAEGYSAGTTNVYTPFVAPGTTQVWRDPHTGNYTQLVSWQRDNHAAYVQAMLWAVTGNTQNRDNAIAILNAWSSLQSMNGGDILLEVGDAQIYEACEIMANSNSGWTGKAAWQNIFANVFRPWCLDLAGANWGTGAIRGRMAMDVFLDDQDDFNTMASAYKHPYFAVKEGLFGGWGWQCAFLSSCLDIGGQDVETVRDQAHTQKELFEMAHICETAWNQGVDLYSYRGNRLLNGFEYTCSLNLSNSVPFSPFYTFDRGASGNASFGTGNYGEFTAGTFELIRNHYITRSGLAAPYTKQVAQMLRPSGEDTLFYYSGTPDPTGLGTVASVNLKSQGGTEGCYVPYGAIKVVWTPAANATGYNIKRATTSGGPYSTIATNLPWDFHWYDTNVNPGTTYCYVVSAVDGSESPNSPESSITLEGPLPAPWASVDIGVSSSSTFSVYNPVPTVNTVCTNGSAYWAENGVNGAYTYSANVYTIAGTGGDIWNTGDVFRFAYQTMSGDGTIVARVVGREGIQDWCKGGLMMRQDLTAGSKNVLMCLTANHGAQQQSRSSAGGASATQLNDGKYLGPYWLKLTRSGNTFTSYISNDGQNWTNFSSVTIAMIDPIYVGLASSSANASQINYASFDNVTTPNTPPPAAPAGLSASGGDGLVQLNWSASSGATGYNLKRSTTNGGPYSIVATNLAGLDWTNIGLANGTMYYYVVAALNAAGESTNSISVNVRPTSTGPVQIASVVSEGQINLLWPSDHIGWQLQAQTNSMNSGLGTNWVMVAGSSSTNQVFIPISSSNGSVFFRLVLP